jgi:hypothetical protein
VTLAVTSVLYAVLVFLYRLEIKVL